MSATTAAAVPVRVKLLSVRMPEPEMRQLKTLAAQRGISLQEAVQQALEAWTMNVASAPPEPLDNLQGSLAGVDIGALRRDERQSESTKESRRV